MIKVLHIRPETLNYTKENITTKLMDLGLRPLYKFDFKGRKVKEKINEWDYIKLKCFCTAKETTNRNKKATN